GNEPRQARRGNRVARARLGIEAQRCEIDKAPAPNVRKRVPVRLELGSLRKPLGETLVDVRLRLPLAVAVLGLHLSVLGQRNDVHTSVPFGVSRDAQAEHEPAFHDLGLGARRDARLTYEVLTPVPEHESAVADLAIALPLLLERVLDLEQVREVGRSLEPQLDLRGLLVVVE